MSVVRMRAGCTRIQERGASHQDRLVVAIQGKGSKSRRRYGGGKGSRIRKAAARPNTQRCGASTGSDVGSIPQDDESEVLPEIYCEPDMNGCPFLPRPLFLLEISADEASNREIDDIVSQCVKAGLANSVLIRDGPLTSSTMLQNASQIYEVCSEMKVKLFVEDRIEILAANFADGILVNGLDMNLVRNMLVAKPAATKVEIKTAYDIEEKDMWEQVEEQEEQEEDRSSPLIGCIVNSAEAAKNTDDENVDFVLVEGNGAQNGAWKNQSAVLTIQDIRKQIGSHMILTSKFCRAVGGPKSSFNVGADGIQIPLLEARRLLSCISEFDKTRLPESGRLLGAILLIAGSTVGAGIIAMPIRTAQAGFLPTMCMLTCAWLFMVLTSMFLVEASLWYGPKANLLSMAQNTLGGYGRTFSMALYLFIYAATLTAYLSEGAAMCTPVFSKLIGRTIPPWLGTSTFALATGAALYTGPKKVDLLNRACVYVALYSFVQLIFRCSGRLQVSYLSRGSWQACSKCIPIMVVAFTFHNIVPSLVGYLGSPKAVVKAIFIGSMIPFVLYTIWQAIILGTLPEQLVLGLQSGTDVINAIGVMSGQIARYVAIFSFFAIVTSLLGVGLGCLDFVKDALPERWVGNSSSGGLVPLLFTIGPPLAIALTCPTIFYSALEFSGTFRLVLFAIVPTLMVWSGRRKGELAWIPGGALPLLAVLTLALMGVSLELYLKTGIKERLAQLLGTMMV